MVVYLSRHPEARKISHTLLAEAVRETWGLPALPELSAGAQGKPFFPSRRDLHFNLSHSGDLAACALDGAPVGLDIQRVRPCRPGLAERVCSGEQRLWLRQRGDSPEAFSLLWALKESRCKQDGQGLTFPVSRIRVPLPEEGETHLTMDGLHFFLCTEPGWALSLCGTGRWDRAIRWLTLSP